jgi:hypothetical protein
LDRKNLGFASSLQKYGKLKKVHTQKDTFSNLALFNELAFVKEEKL